MTEHLPWTPVEDAAIRENFARTSVLLAGRSEGAIKQRAFRLGVFKTSRRMWKPDEELILSSQYPLVGAAGVAALLDRSCVSVHTKAAAMGVRYYGVIRQYCGACGMTKVHSVVDQLRCDTCSGSAHNDSKEV